MPTIGRKMSDASCARDEASAVADRPEQPRVPLTPLRTLTLRARQVFLFDR